MLQLSSQAIDQVLGPKEVSAVAIRAFNPDNHFDVTRMIALYRRCYGESYPFGRVYRHNFWLGQAAPSREARFVNLVAVHGHDFAAHLGFRLNWQGSGAEIISVAVDLNQRQNIFKAGHAAWQTLAKLAHRQNWQSLTHFCPLTHPFSQLLSVKCLHSFETAILPRHIARNDQSNSAILGRYGAVHMYTNLRPGSGDPLKLYPPVRHARMIKSLYEPLALKRQFATPADDESHGFEADRSGLEARLFRRHALLQITIQPSDAVANPSLEASLESLAKSCAAIPYLRIKLTDPACPQLCIIAERHGYDFCGILPDDSSTDYLLYGHLAGTADTALSLYSTRAKTLWEYIRHSRLQ